MGVFQRRAKGTSGNASTTLSQPRSSPLCSELRDHDRPVERTLDGSNFGQGLRTVKELDVLGLCRGEAPDGPAEMNEVRLDRLVERMHVDLVGKTIGFTGIARTAGGHDVGPFVEATAR